MKKVLGLDLGTNSIGWALVEIDHQKRIVRIIGIGSRIIPMNAGDINDFKNGKPVQSSATNRTEKRGSRRINERYLLRRDRLHLVLNLLKALPEHYRLQIDFEKNGKKSGKYKEGKEPKLAYKKVNNKKYEFNFKEAYLEMLDDVGAPEIKNEKKKRIPYDWTLYYLRKKALKEKISLEELAWVLLSYNQKRGYQKTEVIENEVSNKITEELDLKVEKILKNTDEKGKYYEIQLSGNDNFTYKEYSNVTLTEVGDIKEVIKETKKDKKGFLKEDTTTYKVSDIYPLKVIDVIYEKTENAKPHKNTIMFNTGWSLEKESKNYTSKYKNIKGKNFDYIITTTYNKEGTPKDKQSINEPNYSENSSDWTLLKKKTEKEALIYNANNNYTDDNGNVKKYISTKIYDTLKKDAKAGTRTKIIGGMFQVVDREFYREELNDIINTQRKGDQTLNDENIFEECVKLLYPKNETHREQLIKNKDAITHLFTEDILLYQRPLKSKKSEIANCKYEIKHIKTELNKETGEIKEQKFYHKVTSVSNPYFQEFRMWDKINSLKLIELEQKNENSINTNIDVTSKYFKTEDYLALFIFLNKRKSLNQKQFLAFCKKEFNIDAKNHCWNLPEDTEIKGNETRTSFASRFKRCCFTNYSDFLTLEKEHQLWHYLYSVSYLERTKDNKKSLKTFFKKYFNNFEIEEELFNKIVEDFANYPSFPSKYCSYSEKAIKKLLPFIRIGENTFNGKFDITIFEKDLKAINYKQDNINKYVSNLSLNNSEKESKKQAIHYALWEHSINNRILEIIERKKQVDFENSDFEKATDVNAKIPYPKGLFNTFKNYNKIEDFSTFNLTQASYLVYGRHSELAELKYWKSPKQIREEINRELKHNSLNNPIAEKIIREMMQVVADIWAEYGKSKQNYISEIHIELARDLKKSNKEKDKISKNQNENKKQNDRLRKILKEYLTNSEYKAKPYNKDHFERLKILENTALNKLQYSKDKNYKKEINDIIKEPNISKQNFDKYKLWIEQGYQSPYTGKMIKLTDLFNGNLYNIDHVFPQAKITNNSLSNKVVCETVINKLKSNLTGREFILQHQGTKKEYQVDGEKYVVTVVNDDTYVSIVNKQFSGTKRKIMLAKEIPNDFTKSQLNTSRHIARKAMELLSHIVREEGEVEFISKNVLPITGRVTSDLKRAWRLNEVWTELVSPRFKRMNELTQSNLFGNEQTAKNRKKYFDCKIEDDLIEKMEGYDIKRIDHRHHALDALVIALCTKEHVQYINNINSENKSSNFGKQKQSEKQRLTIKKKIKYSKPNKTNPKDNDWFYIRPGAVRQKNINDSSEKTVLKMNYQYKKNNSFKEDYIKMILNSLQNTIVTFKKNTKVINKNNNKTWQWVKKEGKWKKQLVTQEPKKPSDIYINKYNWQIRRSLGKNTYYGKVYLGDVKNKQILKSLDLIFEDPTIIVDNELKKQIISIKKNANSIKEFKTKIKKTFSNTKIQVKQYKIASRVNLDSSFNRDKIEKITDIVIKNILKKHLEKFDTIELPFFKALDYIEATTEKQIFEAIIVDKETKFNSMSDLIGFLKENNFKYKQQNFKSLNIMIDKVKERDFRNEKNDNGKAKFKVSNNPDEAFSPESLIKMNNPEYLKVLNKGKFHHPIKKVRTSVGFGGQYPVSQDKKVVKSKQYIKTDGESNIYIGIFKGINKKGKNIRKYQVIKLADLIELQKVDKKYRLNPFPEKVFDDDNCQYKLVFTLSPNDLVYVPTDEETNEEIESPNLVNFDNLTSEQIKRVYKFVSGDTRQLNFVPYSVASPLWRFYSENKNKIYKILNDAGKINNDVLKIQDEIGLGSQQTKNQKSINGVMIKEVCWKLKVDRLGNVIKLIK